MTTKMLELKRLLIKEEWTADGNNIWTTKGYNGFVLTHSVKDVVIQYYEDDTVEKFTPEQFIGYFKDIHGID